MCRRSGPRKGADVETLLSLSFMDAVNGCTKDVQTTVNSTCGTCEGTGSADKAKPVPCSACHGTGHQTIQEGYTGVIITCRKCGGEGTTIKSPCKTCSGKGVVRETKT
ncbi:molecular chaperone DnaJ, partial [archaeon]